MSIIVGDTRLVLPNLPDGVFHTCVTSPPYFGLRDYDHADQMGLEPTPDEFVAALVDVLREVRRVLRDDGTLWLNLGDSYNAAGRKGHGSRTGFKQGTNRASAAGKDNTRPNVDSLKEKDLIGIPWRVAFALQADGWYLRQDIIWAKPNPMPESVRDRCTKSHEYIFLLSKSPTYYFDSVAMQEPAVGPVGGATGRGKQRSAASYAVRGGQPQRDNSGGLGGNGETRNKRSVWTVATKPYKGAHFATFPPDLIEPCILAGAPVGGLVLDPFSGAGTTGLVAARHGREFVGIELSEKYAAMAEARMAAEAAL